MKALRVYEKNKMVVEEVPVPKLEPHEVLIKVHRVGICGTDLGVLHGYVPAKFPVTLGHEFSGTIAQLGKPFLGGLQVGDPVAASGGWGCGVCDLCQKGLAPFCKNRISLGRNTDGCMAEYVKVDFRVVHRLPPQVTLDEAQNFVNIACVLRGIHKLPLPLGQTAVIFGPGNMGFIALQVLSLAGLSQALMVGRRDFRLEIAKKLGAAHTINEAKEEPVPRILNWYPQGVDIVVEASGNPSCFASSCQVVKSKGTILSYGIYSEKIKELDLSFLYNKEPMILGSKGGEGGYTLALSLLAEKKLQLLPMITHRFPLAEGARAIQTLEDRNINALRVLIEPSA
jgi:threonine dehydrogenase-like Zn-dependent dehydrogenase